MFLLAVFVFTICVFLFIMASEKKSTGTIVAFAVFFLLFRTVCFVGSVSAFVVSDEEDLQVQIEETIEETVEDTVEDTTEMESLTIELIAGEPGEYGELFTMNKGTEFEETYYIYRIPAGTYTVTNIGEYMNQFNVYSDEVRIVDGWEEVAEVFFSKVLDVGISDTFTIKDGQYIDIQGPGKFILERIQ